MTDDNNISLDKRLSCVKYTVSDKPHLFINPDVCKFCKEKPCLYICPSQVYKKNDTMDENIKVEYENCLECGACRIACPYGAIDWNYPEAGCGVCYKFS